MNCRWRQPPDTSHQQSISPEGGTKGSVALRAFLETQPIPVAHATGRKCIALRAEAIQRKLSTFQRFNAHQHFFIRCRDS